MFFVYFVKTRRAVGYLGNCCSSCRSQPHTMVAIPTAAGTIIRPAGADTNHGVVPSARWPLAYPQLRMCPIVVHRYSMDGGRADHEQLCKSSAILTAVFHPYILIPHIATNGVGSPPPLLLPKTFMSSHIDLITYYSTTHHTP